MKSEQVAGFVSESMAGFIGIRSLVTGQIVAVNPAHAVRGPSYSMRKGKTPVLSPAEARQLLESIPTVTISGKRDRALNRRDGSGLICLCY